MANVGTEGLAPAFGPLGSSRTRLIIIRGNSGAGKSTIARLVQQKRKPQLAVISQDVVRRDILRTGPGPDIELIEALTHYCLQRSLDVVIEGHLDAAIYGDMLRGLATAHAGVTAAYFLDVSFDETVRRHGTKTLTEPFGPAEMRQWWQGQRSLVEGLNEQLLAEMTSAEDAVTQICRDIGFAV